jgi:YebC/PmpR family DNA-binding regulatory protein
MGRAFEYRKASKLKRWGAMSKLFPKLGKIITIAAKEGSPDPDMNPRLRTAILTAKAQNMPKHNIEAAIQRASGKDSIDIKELHYEAKGPYGTQFIIDCATDNGTRTVANVKAALTRNASEMLTTGSLNFMFTRKSVFTFDKTEEMDIEELELELIDAGLEDIEEDIEPQEDADDKKIIRIFGEFSAFGDLSKALEEMSIEVTKGQHQYIANTPIDVTDEQMEELDVLIDRLEEDEDVQAVYTNIN